MEPKPQKIERKSIFGKEVFIGLISIALGSYNILNDLNVISFDMKAPGIVANVLLVLGGFFLIIQAYKLLRHEYHLRRIF